MVSKGKPDTIEVDEGSSESELESKVDGFHLSPVKAKGSNEDDQIRPWNGIKGVQRCRYVKFVDGNYVYDKGKSDMYDNEWCGAVVKENMKVKRDAVTYNSLLAALNK